MGARYRLLWADDEADLLQPHILYLRRRGYEVTAVQSGEDALQLVTRQTFDLILLDERMPGLDGLEVLDRLRTLQVDLPVILITKQEDEALMEEAHGRAVADFLTKPVNPSQVLSACKRILEGRRLRGRAVTRDYTQEFGRLSEQLSGPPLSREAWGALAEALAGWAVQLDETGQEGLSESLTALTAQADGVLARQLVAAYPEWVDDRRPWQERLRTAREEEGTPLVTDLMARAVLPMLQAEGRLLLVVLDCLRYDQWLALEGALDDGLRIERRPVFSLLPTATPFGRNALLGARFPDEFAERWPDLWEPGWADADRGPNRYERDAIGEVLEMAGEVFGRFPLASFERIQAPREAEAVARRVGEGPSAGLAVVVVNFLDLLAHGQAESEILQELAPDAAAFRALARGWFERSPIRGLIERSARAGTSVLIATDHGSTQVRRGVEVKADRTATRGLRYKGGRNLVADPRRTHRVEDADSWRLPSLGVTGTWLVALEDAFLVFEHDAGAHKRRFAGSFQHGGISLAECVVPLVTISARERDARS